MMIEYRIALVITNLHHSKWSGLISESAKVIGRNPSADIIIPASFRSVSRQHSKVWLDHKGVWICDLNSTFGTFVNSLKLLPEREQRIVNGDRIVLGSLELTLVNDLQAGVNFLLDDEKSSNESGDTFRSESADSLVHNFDEGLLSALSNAEREVLSWVARGFTTPEEISKQLKRSAHTVRTQFNSIFKKLGVHSRDELVGFLLRNGRDEKPLGGTKLDIDIP